MHGFVATTDRGWFDFFASRGPDVAEVNFWRPSAQGFAALAPGEPFFFKLKGAANAIGGFGLFSRYARSPVWRAWELFGESNGATDETRFRALLARNSSAEARALGPHRPIGCLSLVGCVFLPPDLWVAPPCDWARNIVTGKRYDLTHGEGARILRECLERATALGAGATYESAWVHEALDDARRGRPMMVRPRLGQGGFRLAVVDAYGGACAVTTEHSLPVLEAAHIRPFTSGGPHDVSNGLLLRRDLHRLYDLGYVTVTPDARFRVSRTLRDEFANGREYYARDGERVARPTDPALAPTPEALAWHEESIFRT